MTASGLRSGQVADAAGVNLQTLRYYERRGLLAEPGWSPGGAPAPSAGGGDGAAGDQGRATARVHPGRDLRPARGRPASPQPQPR
ncbi:MerR family DNA-binding transcriptional regulator [Kribbella sp. NPDC051718]|uniref:MerR family DNA-binding transcriptional regulator n=1 Tax=Kribbella sp. NPDC051718 TaxID=3155168 RepID=UPI0034250FFC